MTDYSVASPVPKEVQLALKDYPEFLQQLLFNRGVTDQETAQLFLEPSYDEHLHDPFLLPDMEVAVSRILQAIEKKEHIAVFGDYDSDGIPGTVVLHDFLQAVGHTNFSIHIPHRHYDGFGLSVKAVSKIVAKHSPAILITIDCGTSDLEAAEAAKQAGIDLIITDHHEPKEVLPTATAIVNPKCGDSYPFSELCGAAVIYKVVQAVLAQGDFAIPPGKEKWWLDMVGIATVADMVPLVGENRVLAYYGLQVLRKSRRPGLQQLLRKQRASQPHLTEDDIGFTIGPRINAASRMDTPEDAFGLLASTDEGEAGAFVEHLELLNTQRKTSVGQMTKELHKRVEVVTELPGVLVFGNPEWRPSLVGLAANKLAEEYNRPAFLWGRDGNENCKGSCRSNGVVSVVRLMEAAPQVFQNYGGHHMSGGFTIAPAYLHTFGEMLVQAHEELGTAAAIPTEVSVDAVLQLDDIDKELLQLQRQCAPFGCANPKPIYLFKNITPTEVVLFGKAKEHSKIMFKSSGLVQEAIAFFKTPEQFTQVPKAGQPINILAHLEESYFMGRLQTRLRVVDVVVA